MSADPASITATPLELLPRFTHAFQPVVDLVALRVHAYEALIRGPDGEPAAWVFGSTPPALHPRLDGLSRLAAIRTASSLGIDCRLNLNCSPRLFEASSRALDLEIEAAVGLGFPLDRLVIELTERDAIAEPEMLARHLALYRAEGIGIAIDDFGAGHSGLNMLADFQPDEVKLDMHLIRDIARRGPRQAIVRAIAQACADLGIDVIAEGVETFDEFHWLRSAGITLFQGYLFARPGWASLPTPVFPGTS